MGTFPDASKSIVQDLVLTRSGSENSKRTRFSNGMKAPFTTKPSSVVREYDSPPPTQLFGALVYPNLASWADDEFERIQRAKLNRRTFITSSRITPPSQAKTSE